MSSPEPERLTPEFKRRLRVGLLRCFGVFAGMTLLYIFLPLRGDNSWIGIIVGSAAVLALIPLTVQRVAAIQRSGRPMLVALEALVLLLTLLVYGFAAVYFAMNADNSQLPGIETRLDSVYFVVTTLATVGYGDISPATQAARAIATTQMLLDLAFLGGVIRVLTLVTRRRLSESSPDYREINSEHRSLE